MMMRNTDHRAHRPRRLSPLHPCAPPPLPKPALPPTPPAYPIHPRRCLRWKIAMGTGVITGIAAPSCPGDSGYARQIGEQHFSRRALRGVNRPGYARRARKAAPPVPLPVADFAAYYRNSSPGAICRPGTTSDSNQSISKAKGKSAKIANSRSTAPLTASRPQLRRWFLHHHPAARGDEYVSCAGLGYVACVLLTPA